uniref:Uncharacterized protein n=1 Tax=Candidatus Kentrum eta TaxID=2126337 RepID=A0A450UMK8_9GAMM|nr:MAG: hypothetical protein BECKH772A_GA0070896_100505 [Candidatus Kentron sp. H]VFJ93764.1 MAG: hypothetical protein BECKH772B_GA0070898_100505 [Candidatus Kentron sp. H]VFK00653.1 MAG: hypothetical protein BECKH772C_GA0070978_100505 [Candidatus Kentron sp. H]
MRKSSLTQTRDATAQGTRICVLPITDYSRKKIVAGKHHGLNSLCYLRKITFFCFEAYVIPTNRKGKGCYRTLIPFPFLFIFLTDTFVLA